jgi:transposase-like protein
MAAPTLGIGDGNLGFWAALREVYPETKEQRCWKHKLANVLDKLPKRLQARAKEMLTKDQDRLLTFFDFPAEHWIHFRTTNPIESTFSTVRARTKKTKGAGPRKAGLAMAFKLLLAAEKRWRKVNAPHLVALVKAGVEFPNGEAEMFLSEPAPENLFTHTPSILATEDTLIHNI